MYADVDVRTIELGATNVRSSTNASAPSEGLLALAGIRSTFLGTFPLGLSFSYPRASPPFLPGSKLVFLLKSPVTLTYVEVCPLALVEAPFSLSFAMT